MTTFRVILNDTRDLIFGDDITGSLESSVMSPHKIYIDDTIQSIKNKIIDSLDYEYSYGELYCYSQEAIFLEKQQIYEKLYDYEENNNIKKEDFEGFMLNIQQSYEPREIYEYENILELNDQVLTDVLVGFKQKKITKEDLLFPVSPRNYNGQREPNIYMSDNSLLLNFLYSNTTIYVYTCDYILGFYENIDIQKDIIRLYYPYLYKDEIFDLSSLLLKKQSLITKTKSMIPAGLLKIYSMIDLYNSIYENTKHNSINYENIGIQSFKIEIINSSKIFPLDAIFKSIHATENAPFIRYNPNMRRDTMYRLYSTKKTSQNDKIPFLPNIEIMKYVKMPIKSEQIMILLKYESGGSLIDVFIYINKHGNISIECDFGNNVHDMNVQLIITKIETLMYSCVNPQIAEINDNLENIGYKLPQFKSFEQCVVKNMKYVCSTKISKKININKYRQFLSSMYSIVETNSNKMFFKRVENFIAMDAEDELIALYHKEGYEVGDIIRNVKDEFNITEEEAQQRVHGFIANHMFLQGELVENSGFPFIYNLNNFNNLLTIEVLNINSIHYIGLFMKYIHSFLYLYQNQEDIEDIVDNINELNKKKVNSEEIEKETRIDVIIPEKAIVPIEETAPIDEDFFTTENMDDEDDDEDEEIYGADDDDDDEIYGADDDEEIYGGGGSKTDNLETSLEGMDIKNPTPFQKRIEERDGKLILKTKTEKHNSYSMTCPSSIKRQPVIIDEKEKEFIDKNHPGSYSTHITYGTEPNKQYHYICPRYWSLKLNTSLTHEEVQEILKENPDAIIPHKAKTIPKNAHIFEFNHPKEHMDSKGEYITHYPGLQRDSHPDGYNLPCCFKKMPKEENTKQKVVQSSNYVIDASKFPLTEHRLGFLLGELEDFLQNDHKKSVQKSNPSVIMPNKKCLVRYGVNQDMARSLLCCYTDLYCKLNNMNNISISDMANILYEKITLDDFIKFNNGSFVSLFKLKDGFIVENLNTYSSTDFYKKIDLNNEREKDLLTEIANSYENFRNFILDPYSILDHTYFWSLFCNPNKQLIPSGLNMIIFEINKENHIEVLCPTNVYVANIFDESKPLWLLYKRDMYYEPIYLYENGNYTCLFDKSMSNIHMDYIYEILKTNINQVCKPKKSLPNLDKYSKPQYLETIISILEKYSIEIKNEVMNYQSKVIGVLVVVKEELILLPCMPSSYSKYPLIIYDDSIIENTYKNTIHAYSYIQDKTNSEIKCEVIKKVSSNKFIIGVILENNIFVKTIPENFSKSKDELPIIEGNSASSIETHIYNDVLDKSRIETTYKIYMESQYYSIFRTTIRILLSNPVFKNNKQSIVDIIKSKSPYIEKIESIFNILVQIGKQYVEFDVVKNKLEPNDITTCFNCDNKPNCKSEEGRCVLVIPVKNMHNPKLYNEQLYYTRLSDELIRFHRIRSFILEPNKYLNISNMDYKINKNEILLVDSFMKSDYLNSLVAFDDTYLKNINYEFANPRHDSQNYISAVNLHLP